MSAICSPWVWQRPERSTWLALGDSRTACEVLQQKRIGHLPVGAKGDRHQAATTLSFSLRKNRVNGGKRGSYVTGVSAAIDLASPRIAASVLLATSEPLRLVLVDDPAHSAPTAAAAPAAMLEFAASSSPVCFCFIADLGRDDFLYSSVSQRQAGLAPSRNRLSRSPTGCCCWPRERGSSTLAPGPATTHPFHGNRLFRGRWIRHLRGPCAASFESSLVAPHRDRPGISSQIRLSSAGAAGRVRFRQGREAGAASGEGAAAVGAAGWGRSGFGRRRLRRPPAGRAAVGGRDSGAEHATAAMAIVTIIESSNLHRPPSPPATSCTRRARSAQYAIRCAAQQIQLKTVAIRRLGLTSS